MSARGIERAARIGFIVLGLAGATWLLSVGIATAALDAQRPDMALALRKGDAQALGMAAQDAARFGERERASGLARRAIIASPLSIPGITTLALSEKPGSPPSDELMLAAARMGWRDTYTQVWMVQKAIGAQAPTIAMRRAEALVRLDQQRDLVAMLLRVLAMDPAGRATMVTALAGDPVWRGVFFTHQESIPETQLAGMTAILTDLTRTGKPARPEEARPTLVSLLAAGQPAQAEHLHRLLFEKGRPVIVSNGGFERQDVGYTVDSTASPFDWRFLVAGRSSADIQSSEGAARRVLLASVAGGLEGRIAEQTVILAPGTYELSYRVKPERAEAPRSLKWSIRCSSGVPLLFVSPEARLAPNTWQNVRSRFAVGGQCPSQILELRADPELTSARVDAEFDDVQIVRVG